MSCAHTRDVLDGTAPHVDVTPHLQDCPSCQQHAQALDAVDELCAQLSPPTPSHALCRQTLDIVWDHMAEAQGVTIDERAAMLPPPPVPKDLADRVRARANAAIQDEQRPWFSRHRRAVVVSFAAAAGLLLVAQPSTSPQPSTLTEKGAGISRPELSLLLAVEHDGVMERHRVDGVYGVGDVLYFRAGTDQPTQAMLVRVAAGQASVIHQQALDEPTADLRLTDGVLAWTVEPGEGSADFVLLAGDESVLEDGQILRDLQGNDVDCAHITAMHPAGCAQVHVEVSP